MEFVEIEYSENNKTVRIMVSADSAKDYNGTRLMVSCNQALDYAKQLDCLLLTPKIVDIIHSKSMIIEPVININGRIVANCSIKEYSDLVDKRIGKVQTKFAECFARVNYDTLISGQCKDWVLCTSFRNGQFGLNTAVNYGWHSVSAPYISSVKPWNYRMWQTIGSAHNTSHCDPSQGLRLVRNDFNYCIDGNWYSGKLENALINKDSNEYKIR
jgi:hypothetical protein